MRVALVDDQDVVVEETDRSNVTQDVGTKDGWRWMPLEEDTVDNSTGSSTVATRTGPVVEAKPVFAEERVVYTRTIRDKTQEELDADDEDNAVSVIDERPLNGLSGIVFDQENRLLALESKSPMDADRFRDLYKSKL